MGDLGGLQGCLFSNTHTGTVQEISPISHRGQVISVQGTAIRTAHSSHGVHCNSKGSKTDGHTQGYKDPPVPRLVGESQIPPSLSPAYTDTSKNVPGAGLAGEFRKIRAGTQTSLPLCRLLVRPKLWQGPTHTGPVTDPARESTGVDNLTGLSSPAVHVFDRAANSYREASSPWPAPHEAHTVASQKQLEGTGIARENNSNSKVLAPPSKVVAEESNVHQGQPLCPVKHALQVFTDASKERWGAHLNEHTAKGTSLPESKVHIYIN